MPPPGPGRPRRLWAAACGAGLLALFVAQSVLWMRGHLLSSPPAWDQGLYLFLGLRYFHAWQDGGALALVREMQRLEEAQPPLLPLAAVPFYAAFSDARLWAYATSALFGALLLAATAVLARRRAGDAGGVLALAMTATWSAPLLLSRDYQMDLPGAALLTAALALVERSEGFARRGWSLASGALAGLMVLAKTMAGPFLIGPALWAAARAWKAGERRRVATNVLLATALALAIASVWWAPHLGSAFHYLWYYGWGEGAAPYDPTGGGSLLGLRNLTYYVVAFANEGASVPFFVIAVALLAASGRRSWRATGPRAYDGLLWTWLACGYVLLTIARNKASDRYLIFVVPPLAVLMVAALLRQPRPARRAGLVAVLLAGAANFVGHTWPGHGVPLLKWWPPLRLSAYTPKRVWMRTTLWVPESRWPTSRIVAGLGAARIADQDPLRALMMERALASPAASPEEAVRVAFRALLRRDPEPVARRLAVAGLRDGTRTRPQMVTMLAASTEAARRPLRVLVLPDHPYVNASTLRYQAEWSRAPVTFAQVEPAGPLPDLEDFDAVVVKTGLQGHEPSSARTGLVQAQLDRSRFRLLPVRYPCPDESEVRLYLLGAPATP